MFADLGDIWRQSDDAKNWSGGEEHSVGKSLGMRGEIEIDPITTQAFLGQMYYNVLPGGD